MIEGGNHHIIFVFSSNDNKAAPLSKINQLQLIFSSHQTKICLSKMPSYVVTGASRGLGVRSPPSLSKPKLTRKLQYAFIQKLASNPSNVVIGLVRNKEATLTRLAKDKLQNVHVFEADIVGYPALQKAADEVSKITGGGLDVLINNAAYVSEESIFSTIAEAYVQPPSHSHSSH
jgi:hypothetical protein